MADYSSAIATARRLIQAKGRTVTLQRLEDAPADPAKPWRGPASATPPEATLALSVVQVQPSGANTLGLTIKDEELLRRLSAILIAEPAAEDVETYHRVVEADGSHWRIAFVEKLQPADDAVLYFIGVQR